MLEYIILAAAVLAALTAILAFFKKGLRRAGRFFRKVNSAMDTMNGRPAILHPDTGEVLVDETPGLGLRLATMEEAIVALSQTNKAVLDLNVRVDEVATDVASVAAALEKHVTESLAARHEAQLMWKAVEAVAVASPPDDLVKKEV